MQKDGLKPRLGRETKTSFEQDLGPSLAYLRSEPSDFFSPECRAYLLPSRAGWAGTLGRV